MSVKHMLSKKLLGVAIAIVLVVVTIAVALITEPKFLIFDELT